MDALDKADPNLAKFIKQIAQIGPAFTTDSDSMRSMLNTLNGADQTRDDFLSLIRIGEIDRSTNPGEVTLASLFQMKAGEVAFCFHGDLVENLKDAPELISTLKTMITEARRQKIEPHKLFDQANTLFNNSLNTDYSHIQLN